MIENFDIQVDEAQLNDIKKRLGKLEGKAPAVLRNAINRAAQKAKTETKQEVASRYIILQKDVAETIRVTKASTSKLSAKLTSVGSPRALTKFKVSPKRIVTRTKRGKPSPAVYKAQVMKAGELKPLSGDPKAFFATMKSGHKGIMERVSSRRLPIKELYGPAIPSMVKNEEVLEKIKKEAAETLEKRIEAEVNNILQRG
ncbi:MAG: hypothetical protein HFG80_10685 [Eubacterium sp.]|nr:hypothetical protein [Eubacterium sp.]